MLNSKPIIENPLIFVPINLNYEFSKLLKEETELYLQLIMALSRKNKRFTLKSAKKILRLLDADDTQLSNKRTSSNYHIYFGTTYLGSCNHKRYNYYVTLKMILAQALAAQTIPHSLNMDQLRNYLNKRV